MSTQRESVDAIVLDHWTVLDSPKLMDVHTKLLAVLKKEDGTMTGQEMIRFKEIAWAARDLAFALRHSK
jgi:hypothetical protein